MIEMKAEFRSKRAKKTLKELLKRIGNKKPIWMKFKDYWQNDLMKRVWDGKGAVMEGGRWAALTPAYVKWKQKKGGGGRLMELTGRLYDAVRGQGGWFDKIDKKSMTMGVQGNEYFYWVQHRQKKPRYYFYTRKEDLPKRAYAYLIKITDEYLEGADDK